MQCDQFVCGEHVLQQIPALGALDEHCLSLNCSTPTSTDSSSRHSQSGRASSSSSRVSSAPHRIAFQSLNAAISRTNDILADTVIESASFTRHSARNGADMPVAQSSEAALGTDGKADQKTPQDLTHLGHEAGDAAESAGPFDGVLGADNNLGCESCRGDTGYSKSSAGESCSIAETVNEQAVARAEAAVKRHSMAASWIADLRLIPAAPSPHPSQCGADDAALLQPHECSDELSSSALWRQVEEHSASPSGNKRQADKHAAGKHQADKHQAVFTTRSSSGWDSPNEIDGGQTEAVHAQMNRAIAAALVSAAVSAVVESHAAAERAALLAQAHEQHAAAELKHQQKEAEALETAVAHVRARIAAMRVVRHWKAWRQSPAWSKRAVAATVIQAYTRGALVRRNLPALHHRAACMKQVRTCMKNQTASAALLQSAVQSAQELGDERAMHALSSRMDAVAGRLAAAVMSAARTGSHAQYLRVRAEAEAVNPLLQQCLVDAAQCMCHRQQDAVQQLGDACQSDNLSEYSTALQHATSCGAEPVLVARQKQVWDSRCSVVAQELSAAVHAKEFDGAEFSNYQQKAQDLGLDDALRAANSHLKSRRSALIREIHLARKGGNMEALQSLRARAVALDMPDVLLSVDSTLETHVAVAKQKLQAAAITCVSSSLFSSYVQAAKNARVPEELLSSCQATFFKRTQQVVTTLLQSAESEPLSSLVPLVRHAWALHRQDAVCKATELATARTRECCATLRSALSAIADSTDAVRERANSEGCATSPSLSCLAAALHASKLSSPQSSRQLPCASPSPIVLLPNNTSEACESSRPSCMCTICSACQRISAAMLDAVGLHLGEVASRAAAALHWGIYRSSLAAVSLKTVCTILHSYFGWIEWGNGTGASNANMIVREDQVLESYEAQFTLYPCTHAADPATACCSAGLMLGFRSFQEHHQARSMHQGEPSVTDQVQPSVALTTVNSQIDVPEGALDLSKVLLQTILGGTDYFNTKQLCLMFSGLRSLGSLGTWCPHLQCLSLKANHLKCLRPLAPLASHLSHLDISDNSIATLTSLSMLTSLRSLAASNNQLTSFHGLSGMKHLQVFMASHNNVCSVDVSTFASPYMAHIDLSGNCITCIAGLRECPRLLTADLSRNLIVSLQALRSCSLLQDLSVNENRVDSIDGVFCKHLCLQRLKVATNRISTLTALPWLPHLRSLDVSDNPLSTMHPLSLQPTLTKLNMSFCSLSQESIMAAIAPLSHLADLQAHDSSAPQAQNHRAEANSPLVQAATLRTLPWLRDLDHMETRCCDVISAAVKAFYLSPRLLLAWRQQVQSSSNRTHPISTQLLEAMSSRTDTVRQLDAEDDTCSAGEIMAALGMPGGVQMPVIRCATSAYTPSDSRKGSFEEHHAASQMNGKLQEQYRLLTAHSGACTQLLRSLSAGGDVDQSLCVEQLSTALHQSQTSAAASVLSVIHWLPRPGPTLVQGNPEWQDRWAAGREKCAARIQHAWRRRQACRSQSLKRRNIAAACIQSWVRGARVRRENLLQELRQELHERQRCAVLTVQAAWRGYRVRSLLYQARLAAQDLAIGARREMGSEGSPSSSGSNEDISLPELGNDLMRELDLLDCCPVSTGPLVAGSMGAGQAPGSLSNASVSMATTTDGAGHHHHSDPLPQLSARSSCNRAPDVQPQSQTSCGQGPSGGTAGNAGNVNHSVGAESALVRRYRQHKMQQAGKQQMGSSSESMDSGINHSAGMGEHGRAAPAHGPPAGMPHVHDAALAAIRLQQQQYQEALLPVNPPMPKLQGAQSPVPAHTGLSHQEPEHECSNPSHPATVGRQTFGQTHDVSKRASKAEAVMNEWGFENEATAKAYLLSKRRMQNKKASRGARRVHPSSQPHVRLSLT